MQFSAKPIDVGDINPKMNGVNLNGAQKSNHTSNFNNQVNGQQMAFNEKIPEAKSRNLNGMEFDKKLGSHVE